MVNNPYDIKVKVTLTVHPDDDDGEACDAADHTRAGGWGGVGVDNTKSIFSDDWKQLMVNDDDEPKKIQGKINWMPDTQLPSCLIQTQSRKGYQLSFHPSPPAPTSKKWKLFRSKNFQYWEIRMLHWMTLRHAMPMSYLEYGLKPKPTKKNTRQEWGTRLSFSVMCFQHITTTTTIIIIIIIMWNNITCNTNRKQRMAATPIP